MRIAASTIGPDENYHTQKYGAESANGDDNGARSKVSPPCDAQTCKQQIGLPGRRPPAHVETALLARIDFEASRFFNSCIATAVDKNGENRGAGISTGGVAMDEAVARENIKHFRKLLETETDETKRKTIAQLLIEEGAKLERAIQRKSKR